MGFPSGCRAGASTSSPLRERQMPGAWARSGPAAPPDLRLVCKTSTSCWGGLGAPEPPGTFPVMGAGSAALAGEAAAVGHTQACSPS